MKAADLINNAAIMAGIQAIGDTMEGTYSIYALGRLNSLIDSWQIDGLYIPSITEIVQTVTGNPVTIGTSQTINVSVPNTILNTSFFRTSGNDYPLSIISESQYNLIQAKTTTGIPNVVYFDSASPIGRLYFFPVPTAMELHLQINSTLPSFADLTTDVNIDKGYQAALELSLAEMLLLGVKEVPAELSRQAIRARKILKVNNLRIDEMNLPSDLQNVVYGYR